jgi:uncharacterized membrane protein YhaH (DUF805 family)
LEDFAVTVPQKLFSLQGRLRRRDYWLFSFALVLAALAVLIPSVMALGLDVSDPRVSLVSLVVVWPSLAMLVKRIHDRNKSGWLAAIYWVPSVAAIILEAFPADGLRPIVTGLNVITGLTGLWFLIEFGFMDGTQGPNRFGKSPKGIGGEPSDKLAEVFA